MKTIKITDIESGKELEIVEEKNGCEGCFYYTMTGCNRFPKFVCLMAQIIFKEVTKREDENLLELNHLANSLIFQYERKNNKDKEGSK